MQTRLPTVPTTRQPRPLSSTPASFADSIGPCTTINIKNHLSICRPDDPPRGRSHWSPGLQLPSPYHRSAPPVAGIKFSSPHIPKNFISAQHTSAPLSPLIAQFRLPPT